MMKIAVLSDTHNVLRPEVRELIGQVDAVVHAGDITSQKVLWEIQSSLRKGAFFQAVRGNGDLELRTLPLVSRFELEGVSFLCAHKKADLPRERGQERIVITGHTHRYLEKTEGGILFLNPGSAGRSRSGRESSMVLLTVSSGSFDLQKIDLSDAGEMETLAKDRGEIMKALEPAEASLLRIQEIFRRMDRGKKPGEIADSLGLSPKLVEEVLRIRVTHPGVTPGGVLDRMEVNSRTGYRDLKDKASHYTL